MAKKISQLTQATEVKSDDVTVIVQDGETKKLPLNMMVTKQDIENKKIAGLAKLDEIEATYENDTYTPTITVKNKSSVKTGEGDEVDYSANVMDGHAKSATLKGQTLMNDIDLTNRLLTSGNTITSDGYITINANSGYSNAFVGYKKIKPNTKYLCVVDINEYTANGEFSLTSANPQSVFNVVTTLNSGEIGVKKFILTSRDTIDESVAKYSFRSYLNSNSTNGYVKYRVMMIEYQEGMENWDIPYFEGMQSVKMPVLKTTGKNLLTGLTETPNTNYTFDKGILTTSKHGTWGRYGIEWHLNLKKDVSYYFHCDLISGNYRTNLYKKDGTLVGNDFGTNLTHSYYTVPEDGEYIFVVGSNQNNVEVVISNLQLTTEKTKTSYEPYKSNILTVNEDVTLRGIGDVKDELNLLNGKLTQRVEGIVLDGSEDEVWVSSRQITINGVAYGQYYLTSLVIPSNNYIGATAVPTLLCDKGVTDPFNGLWMGGSIKTISLRELNGKYHLCMNFPLNEDIKLWLQQNHMTLYYQLEKESIKTVDLMPSGTHPSTTPYCWKNGLIQLSSSGLLPNLEYSVVTSRAGQINQNATMIVKNDKRIFDLEILLAGGLVNTTYQALTLQNQVETGLSKVSLNSETEPDYLLYHMIMKLIEEKAYKLDDLTEKVSVFYLYEKLSDEQFETIYSALYPFVEDEIVEEPVVEELPEVVEDEVIM